ncbi:MAG: hypothetical protein HC828_11165, partial [Blastochloris sp.]|nr:hypothetical protein [Blastochloris sp.]
AIAAPALRALLAEGTVNTFNAVTVDGDTSTSDTLMMFATGKANNAPKIARKSIRLRLLNRKVNPSRVADTPPQTTVSITLARVKSASPHCCSTPLTTRARLGTMIISGQPNAQLTSKRNISATVSTIVPMLSAPRTGHVNRSPLCS